MEQISEIEVTDFDDFRRVLYNYRRFKVDIMMDLTCKVLLTQLIDSGANSGNIYGFNYKNGEIITNENGRLKISEESLSEEGGVFLVKYSTWNKRIIYSHKYKINYKGLV